MDPSALSMFADQLQSTGVEVFLACMNGIRGMSSALLVYFFGLGRQFGCVWRGMAEKRCQRYDKETSVVGR